MSIGSPAGDKLDILVTLVETYEEKALATEEPGRFDPVDVLRYAIEELGHSQAELADILGSRSRASEVLARRRPLTLEIIQKINASWKIPADLLVRPYSDRCNGSLSELMTSSAPRPRTSSASSEVTLRAAA